MKLDWLIQSVNDMHSAPKLWLTPAELTRYESFRFDKRRQEWLLGRWTAKRLLQAAAQARARAVPLHLHDIEISNTDAGVPQANLQNGAHARRCALSISHSNSHALAATLGEMPLRGKPVHFGCDLERTLDQAPPWLRDYCTPAESAWVDRAPSEMQGKYAIAIWSAKEAALKALGLGLSVDTRAVEIQLDTQPHTYGWMPYAVRFDLDRLPPGTDPRGMFGWWRLWNTFCLTLAATSSAVTTTPGPVQIEESL